MSLIVMLQDVESSTVLQHILKKPAHCSRNTAHQVLNLLFKIVIRKYPRLENVTESILMEWRMWPNFLGMIGRYIHKANYTL